MQKISATDYPSLARRVFILSRLEEAMSWSVVSFGKHEGKSLPQIIFSDPDWFFWAIENDAFKGKGRLEKEAEELDRKARTIKIPQSGEEQLVAEYAVHGPTGKFADMELVPVSRPPHEGSTPTSRRDVIDLSVPRQIADYDKLGYRNLLASVKFYLFGRLDARMTRKRCEEFFENDANFE